MAVVSRKLMSGHVTLVSLFSGKDMRCVEMEQRGKEVYGSINDIHEQIKGV